MQTEFKIPDLGENIEGGDVVGVLVNKGDTIKEDHPVIELETEKAVVEVPSSVSGVIVDVHISEGDSATIGQLLLTVETEDTNPNEVEAPPPSQIDTETPEETSEVINTGPDLKDVAKGLIEFKLPDLGENIEGGEVVSIMVSLGDHLQENLSLIHISEPTRPY